MRSRRACAVAPVDEGSRVGARPASRSRQRSVESVVWHRRSRPQLVKRITNYEPSLLDRLKKKFGDKITGANSTSHRSLDRSRARPRLSKSARICATSQDLQFDYPATASRASTTSSPIRRRRPRSSWQPHTRSRLSPLRACTHKHSLVLKVMLPRWKDDVAGRTARSADRSPASGARPTGTSAKCYDLCGVRLHRPSRTCGAFSARKIGSAIRCAKTTRCRWNTTAFAAGSRRSTDFRLDTLTTRHCRSSWPRNSTIRGSSNSTSAPTRCSSTWDRSIPARTACCGWCCGPTAKSSREVTPHIGYLHRCAEKIGENLTPRQWIPYTDRMDYLAGDEHESRLGADASKS